MVAPFAIELIKRRRLTLEPLFDRFPQQCAGTMQPTATPALLGSAPGPPPASEPLRLDRKLPGKRSRRTADLALLFKNLATLRTDARLFKEVEMLRGRGPTPAFAAWAKKMEAPRLLERCEKAAARMAAPRRTSDKRIRRQP